MNILKKLLFASVVIVAALAELHAQNRDTVQDSKLLIRAELGFMAGRSYQNAFTWTMQPASEAALSMRMMVGKRVSKHGALGLSFGVDGFPINVLLPIGVEWNGTFGQKGRIRPFYELRSGHALPFRGKESQNGTEMDYQGGFFWHGGVGIKMVGAGQDAFSLSIGYRHQRAATVRSEQWGGDFREEYDFNRMVVAFGYWF